MTPEELLAVLPRISALTPSLPGLPAESDAETVAAVALAGETPRSPRDLARAAARASPLLGFLAAIFLPLAAPGRRWLYLSALWGAVPGVLLAVSLYPFIASAAGADDPAAAFGTLRIAVGAAGIAWFDLASCATVSLLDYDGATRPQNHMLTVLSRWLDVAGGGPRSEPLAKAEDGSAGSDGLADHMDGDPDCPCARETCSGRVGTHAALFFLADFCVRLPLIVLYCAILPMWTPAFSAGGVLWRTWWGCLVGASSIATTFLSALTALALAFIAPRPPVTRLSARLQRRAVSLRLAALVRRYRALLLLPSDGTDPTERPVPYEPYEPLLRHLSTSWSGIRSGSAKTVQRVALVGLLLVPPAIANLALSCIPAWEIAAFLWWAFFVLQSLPPGLRRGQRPNRHGRGRGARGADRDPVAARGSPRVRRVRRPRAGGSRGRPGGARGPARGVPGRRRARAALRVRGGVRDRQDSVRDDADAGVCGVGRAEGAGRTGGARVVLPALGALAELHLSVASRLRTLLVAALDPARGIGPRPAAGPRRREVPSGSHGCSEALAVPVARSPRTERNYPSPVSMRPSSPPAEYREAASEGGPLPGSRSSTLHRGPRTPAEPGSRPLTPSFAVARHWPRCAGKGVEFMRFSNPREPTRRRGKPCDRSTPREDRQPDTSQPPWRSRGTATSTRRVPRRGRTPPSRPARANPPPRSRTGTPKATAPTTTRTATPYDILRTLRDRIAGANLALGPYMGRREDDPEVDRVMLHVLCPPDQVRLLRGIWEIIDGPEHAEWFARLVETVVAAHADLVEGGGSGGAASRGRTGTGGSSSSTDFRSSVRFSVPRHRRRSTPLPAAEDEGYRGRAPPIDYSTSKVPELPSVLRRQ